MVPQESSKKSATSQDLPKESTHTMQPPAKQLHKQQRLLTAKNGFVLHVSPRTKPKELKMAKSAGPHLIYGISYAYPIPMPVTLSN